MKSWCLGGVLTVTMCGFLTPLFGRLETFWVAWMWPVSWPWTQRWLHVFLPAPCVCGCCPAPSGSAPPSPASCPAGAAGSSGRSLSPGPPSGRSAPAPLPDGPRCPLNATPAPTEVGQSLNKAVQGPEYVALQCVLTSNLLTWPLWNSSLFSRSHTRASCLLTMLRPTVDDSRNCTLDTLCWSCTTMRWRERGESTFRETNNSSGECDRAPPAGLWRGVELIRSLNTWFINISCSDRLTSSCRECLCFFTSSSSAWSSLIWVISLED